MKKFITAILLTLALTLPSSAAVTSFIGNTFYGLSADTKPNVADGSRFWESDTKKWYVRQTGVWVDWTPTGSGTAEDNVTDETSFGISPVPGVATTYSRGDHTHGTPPNPVPDHAAETSSVHNFDASGNAPAQAHDNTRHSTAYLAASDTDYVFILQDVLKKLCSGLYTGGAISINVSQTSVDIATGTGVVNDHAGTHNTVSWGNLNVSPAGNGTNYVAINGDGTADVSLTRQPQGTHVRLGHFFAQGGYILEAFSTPDWAQHFMGRVIEFISGGIGSLVDNGLGVSEQGTALKLSVAAGTYRSKLGTFTTSTITTFYKMYNSADMGWGQDSTNPNYVNVTQWNNVTNTQATALVTMTAGYWKKDLVMITPSGNVYYMFGQAEYSTEDLAKKGALPVIPGAIAEDGCYLLAIVSQKNDASIATRMWDIRPDLARIFGYGTGVSSVIVDHETLSGLQGGTAGQHYHLTSAETGKLVTNGDSHDHNGGDGAQIAYGSLSGAPTLYYQTVQDEGTARTQRAALNFVGSGVSCADDTTKTTCTITAGSGSFSVTQVEVDAGWPLSVNKSFTITDASVTAGMKIMATVAYDDTSDGRPADEYELNLPEVVAGKAAAGSFTLVLWSRTGWVGGKYKVNYTYSM